MLKASYVGLTTFYWVRGECPLLFKPFVVIDAVMFVLFLLAYQGTDPRRHASGSAESGTPRS